MSLLEIFLISLLFSNSLSLNFNLSLKSESDSILKQLFDGIIQIIMKNASQINIFSNITQKCNNTLDRTFFLLNKTDVDEEELLLANYYYSKLLLDSSTNVNDLSTYPNCMDRNHQYDFSILKKRKPLKPEYVTIFVDYREKLMEYFRKGERTTTYLIGICFVENCTDDDLKTLLKKILKLIKLIKEDQYLNINVYPLNRQDYKPSFISIFLKFIPLHIFMLHLFIILFHKYIEYVYKKIKDICCYKKKPIKIVARIENNIDEQDSISNDSFVKMHNKKNETKQNQNFRNYIKVLFNIDKNFDFLTKIDDKNEIHNDSSLSYMNGIKGISMIAALFGFIFIDLYNVPVTKQTIENFYDNLNSPFFFIFYFGIKFAPKLLLCSSGFSLFYKFMCFLDDKLEAEKSILKMQMNEKKKEKNNIVNSSLDKYNDNIDNSKSSSYYESMSERSKKTREEFLIPYKYYFLFLGSQIHKYILYLLILFFILYSLYDFALLFIDLGPMWSFFNKLMIETSHNFSSIFFSIFCLQGYFFSPLNKDSILNYFHLVYQEVIFFVISTLVIFLGYRYHLRIDRFILGTIVFLFAFRIIYYNISDDLNVKEYYSFNGYSLFYNSIAYNYLYYALGIYFGFLNYVMQKRYTYYECDKQNKTYLLGFTRLVKIIKNKSKLLFYSFGIIFLILIIIFSFGQYLLFKYNDLANDYDGKPETIPQKLTDYNNDSFVSVMMLIDSDIVVLLVNFMALFFYLKGDNFINDFLNLDFWGIFNKIYFSFLLLINPIILYVFYITESKIEFDMQNCYLYSFACGILLFVLVILVYGLFELPYKKTIKLFLKRNEIKVGQKTLDYMEDNTIMKQIELKGDLGKNKNDSFNDEDNEENEEDNLEIKLNENLVDNNKEKEE